MTDVKRHIEDLRERINKATKEYYVDNAPTMSDFDFDMLLNELISLESEYPEFITEDSPTQRVGSDLGNKGFKQYKHAHAMLSLGNTYSLSEIEDFASRATKDLEGKSFTYSLELKFDGLSISLHYKNGHLIQALTRGDGQQGDDVTRNVLKIKNIPKVLSGDYPEDFEIRGEIYMPFKSFDALNAERAAAEEPLFANPRNAASGSLKLQDSAAIAKRGLECTLYHYICPERQYATHSEALDAAASWGLPVSEHRRTVGNITEIEDYINHWDTARKQLPFPIDGIVIKINEREYQEYLGFTAKSPRWAVAYKFKAEKALTQLLSVDFQVGRTGAITPVANLQKVLLSGTYVKRASLHNEDQIRLHDIHIGDWVYVEKGGEIIPKITGVELSQRSLAIEDIEYPTTCPECGTPLVREEGEAKSFCPNTLGCPVQIKGRMLHFTTRKAMNILAGDATIEQLYNLGLAKSPADFYEITAVELSALKEWKDKSISNFLESLQKSKQVPFERVLYALGIRHVGATTAALLARTFQNIDALANATMEELQAVGDIGAVIAESVYTALHDERFLSDIQRLKAQGIQFEVKQMQQQGEALKDCQIVISGTFSISRDAMKDLIEANGGKNVSSVSRKTTYLLAGNAPGPEKIKKAEELGIQIINEDEFNALIGREPAPQQLTLF